jgi:hypothetical protein
MALLAKLQWVGPVAVFTAIVAAEGAAFALDEFPSSKTLWRVNLELFGIFQKSHYFISSLGDIAHPQVIMVAMPLLSLAICGTILQKPLLVAMAGNLSCLYPSFLLYVWYANEHLPDEALATLAAATKIAAGPDLLICSLLLGSSLLSLCASHIRYIHQLCRNPNE